jgi:hypothetical protein
MRTPLALPAVKTMYELLFAVCSLANNKECRELRIPETFTTTVSCYSQAQGYLATYLRDHEDWVIKKWECIPEKERRT